MPRLYAGLAAVLVAVAASPAAWASSLPKVDFGSQPSVGLGVGTNQAFTTGGSVSIDIPFLDVFQVGGAIATRLDGSVNYDVRAMYRFIEGGTEGPSIAGMLGVSVRTLEGWEQGRRRPGGPARALLVTIAHNPTAYFDAIAAWNAQ